MKECISLFKEQDDLFKTSNGRVEAIKDYLKSYKHRLSVGAEYHMFTLPREEKIELLRFYIKMFGNVFDEDPLWDTLTVKEKIEICKE